MGVKKKLQMKDGDAIKALAYQYAMLNRILDTFKVFGGDQKKITYFFGEIM